MRVPASSARAAVALGLVERLQRRFVDALEAWAAACGAPVTFAPTEWLRDAGRHGGGVRLGCGGTPAFNQASVNVSQVHYDDEPARPLASATALSAIVHPAHPRAPSLHLHVSFTETRDGNGGFRVMADLNPSHPDAAQTARFEAALEAAAGPRYRPARANGDTYFFIPALGRHRGVSHFYLEQFATFDFAADVAFAEALEARVIDTYAALLEDSRQRFLHASPTPAEARAQLEYHTAYLFQVLTLDRGTTSGLLVHDQNDAGIMGSLPAFVDRALLASWEAKVPPPQDALVRALAAALPDAAPAPVSDDARLALAAAVRAHYRAHPDALALQAKGDVVPPTVANHGR